MNASARSALQAAASALNGARSKGPKTSEGKSRSAMNALRHGLSANNLLLPGEDAQEYESHLDGYFTTFAPATLPEALVVAQLGDLAWKLERLSKLENNRSRALLEEELEKTDKHRSVVLTRRALQMVNALVGAMEAVPMPPADAERTEALLDGVKRMVAELHGVPEMPSALIQPLANALDAAKESLNGNRIPPATYEHLGNMAKLARGALGVKLAQEEEALGPVRERLAAEVLLLEDADLKKVERHRRLLENSMQRQLDLLGQVRSQVASAQPEHQAEAKELRVKLRLVK
ncbi:uncharacterized protein STAUR_6091 [Stigmatella aurantiaca DW4/3-1]|nr:uncharacterized protein STAUR_6091 [Stigmatella aurantiaca DW4/3-1]